MAKTFLILISLIISGCVSNCDVKPIIPSKQILKTYSIEEKKRILEEVKIWNYDCLNPDFTGLDNNENREKQP